MAARGDANQCRTVSGTGSTASCPASGSRMMPEKKPGRRLVRLARSHADGGQADADAVEDPAPAVVREQQLADRFLRAVARERRVQELVADRLGERRAEYRDR